MGTSAYQTQNQQVDPGMQIIQNLMHDNPNLRFRKPDGYLGNRPVYLSDAPSQKVAEATRSWLEDPEGWSGRTADFPTMTPDPTGPVATRRPDLTLLPAYVPVVLSAADQYAQALAAAAPAILKMGGTLTGASDVTPKQINDTTGTSYWVGGQQVSKQAYDNVGAALVNVIPSAPTMLAPATPVSAATPQPKLALPAAIVPPITGNVNERYLVDGKLTDGAGTVLLNTNRPATQVDNVTGAILPKTAGGIVVTDPQGLPAVNTVATAPSNWGKYLPYALGGIALILLLVALKKHKG